MKEKVAVARDLLALLRETVVVVLVLLVVVNYNQVGAWLVAHGFTRLEFAGNVITLDQFKQQVTTLNSVNKALDASTDVGVKHELTAVQRDLGVTVANQVAALSRTTPNLLPQGGWIYLGTLAQDRSAWRGNVAPTVRSSWPLRVNDVLTLATNVNLRGDSTSETRPRAPILSVLPDGTRVKLLELDDKRRVPDGDPDAPGYRLWGRIELDGA